MPSLKYVHVDVFSDAPFSGNSLLVFLDSTGLTSSEMLRITREVRHFESIFVGRPGRDNEVQARVFDLFEELPFAGHPLLGAAVALHHQGGGPGVQTWRFALPERTATVVTRRGAGGYHGVLDQGAPRFGMIVEDRDPVARAFDLALGDLVADLPVEVVSTGLRYLVVPVLNGALERARVVTDLTPLLGRCGAQFAVLLDEAGLEIRHWNNDGVIEDVATGSAAGAIGAYRVKYELARPGAEFVIRQGRFAGRPSRMFVRPETGHGGDGSIRVGGAVSLVGAGELFPLPRRPGALFGKPGGSPPSLPV